VPPTTRLVLASWFKDPPVSLLLASDLKAPTAKRTGYLLAGASTYSKAVRTGWLPL
jgi:hypothetical protein